MGRNPTTAETRDCPNCGHRCYRIAVFFGYGVAFGPWGCPSCGWSAVFEFDLSSGKSRFDNPGGAIDQYGLYHPPGSVMARIYRIATEEGADGP